MRRWNGPLLRLPARTVALVVLAAGLAACGPPSYRFTASDADDLVLKVPRSWSLVKSGVPATSDGTPAEAGNWFAVYDAAPRPSLDHVSAPHTTAPVAVVRTLVVTKEQGQAASGDTLRDAWLPVTDTARASAVLQGFAGKDFQLLKNENVTSRTADGVHVVFGYDLGEGMELYDELVLTDKSKTRIHLFLVHCSKGCYDSNHTAITDTMRSFTVRRT